MKNKFYDFVRNPVVRTMSGLTLLLAGAGCSDEITYHGIHNTGCETLQGFGYGYDGDVPSKFQFEFDSRRKDQRIIPKYLLDMNRKTTFDNLPLSEDDAKKELETGKKYDITFDGSLTIREGEVIIGRGKILNINSCD